MYEVMIVPVSESLAQMYDKWHVKNQWPRLKMKINLSLFSFFFFPLSRFLLPSCGLSTAMIHHHCVFVLRITHKTSDRKHNRYATKEIMQFMKTYNPSLSLLVIFPRHDRQRSLPPPRQTDDVVCYHCRCIVELASQVPLHTPLSQFQGSTQIQLEPKAMKQSREVENVGGRRSRRISYAIFIKNSKIPNA